MEYCFIGNDCCRVVPGPLPALSFARATVYAVEASLGNEVVWSMVAQTATAPAISIMQLYHPITN
jgi:hypothetical protein